jgi:hypothetical protein
MEKGGGKGSGWEMGRMIDRMKGGRCRRNMKKGGLGVVK